MLSRFAVSRRMLSWNSAWLRRLSIFTLSLRTNCR
jgi:hypothetical protein